MNKNHYCVIMAGGAGERFWPVSKGNHPKQFIDILESGSTLIQQTYRRLSRIFLPENILVVINEQYLPLVNEQLPQIPPENVLCEPARRNTAPCIAYACHKIAAKHSDAIILVAPSDHVILNESEFIDTLNVAMKAAAQQEWLFTLGIQPSRPETGYGYIKFREGIFYQQDDTRIYKVSTFTEKPSVEIAQQFLKSGDYLWNAGIFIWSAAAIIGALEKYLPDINDFFKPKAIPYHTPQEHEAIQEAYSKCRSMSVDYGVMEKADNVYVLKSDFGWSDLGTWGSLFAFLQKNEQNNAVFGENVLMYDANNNLVKMPSEKLVVLQGLDGYVVVENDNILLVCKKDAEKRMREIINDIRLNKGERYL
ncbi:MAG: mannose-1-phosphate guanylyltransferase [Bacteroidales bacterium]|nr:mannose-1-phosphate guanylyltransferase [Bacteroidales bacterium]